LIIDAGISRSETFAKYAPPKWRYLRADGFEGSAIADPVYRLAVVHRQAAVATSRLIRCEPREAGAGFA
jgi:hypothetical protein